MMIVRLAALSAILLCGTSLLALGTAGAAADRVLLAVLGGVIIALVAFMLGVLVGKATRS